ncbi:MAG: DUF6364 family protein [Gammaproteobacteria bacterium]|nr:DUF6364 family protein [Gammaproteobacteria bacterium]MCY4276542.1 DUF6364 family protein [Gammaproteobacteria bacterium]
MNITLSVNDQVVAKALRIAAARGTSLNQMIRDYLQKVTQLDDLDAVVADLERRWDTEDYRSYGAWSREEMHERSEDS